MRTSTSYASWFVSATLDVAKLADRLHRETGCAWHFLYYQPRGLAFYVVADGAVAPTGAQLVTGERIPSHLTVDQLTGWIRNLASRVDVLPGE